MFEKLDVLIFGSILPAAALGVVFSAIGFFKTGTKHRILLGISGVAGLAGAAVAAAASAESFLYGNFLAPLTFVVYAPLLGGFFALFVYVVGAIIVVPMEGVRRRDPTTPGASRVNGFALAGIFCLSVFAAEVAYLRHKIYLQRTYGTVMDTSRRRLTEDEIRRAYADPIFRRHNLFLRGMLMQPNVPRDIAEEVLKTTTDVNVERGARHALERPKEKENPPPARAVPATPRRKDLGSSAAEIPCGDGSLRLNVRRFGRDDGDVDLEPSLSYLGRPLSDGPNTAATQRFLDDGGLTRPVEKEVFLPNLDPRNAALRESWFVFVKPGVFTPNEFQALGECLSARRDELNAHFEGHPLGAVVYADPPL